MRRILIAALCAGAVAAVHAEAQVVVHGPSQYKLSGVTFTKSAAGVVVTANLSPTPAAGVRLDLVVFAPTGASSLAKLDVAGGRYAMSMDAAGVYYNFDLKGGAGAGPSVGALIIHELQKTELTGRSIKILLKHRLAVRNNEPFPTGGRLEVALATEGKDAQGKQQFTIVSNAAAGTAK